MKKYEKLAYDWIEERDNNGFDVYGERDSVADAFIAGFLKAREMAYELMEKHPESYHFDIDITNLGEEEDQS